MNEAAKTDFLIERINQNANYQSLDINEWAFDKIQSGEEHLHILELCCGTGKQTKYLLKNFPNAVVSCLDISADAIEKIKIDNKEDQHRMNFYVSGLDEFFAGNENRYDIIFVSYGLYYATDIKYVLYSINSCLNKGGKFLVMGPYGKNNKQLFDVLINAGVKIAEPVIHSSCTFMYEEVIKFSINGFSDIHIYTVQNRVKWIDKRSIMSYWANTTFYDYSRKNDVEFLIDKELKECGCFVNDKHIMLIEAVKK